MCSNYKFINLWSWGVFNGFLISLYGLNSLIDRKVGLALSKKSYPQISDVKSYSEELSKFFNHYIKECFVTILKVL